MARDSDLLDLAGYREGQRLLDLCGGTGALAKEALARQPGNPVSLLDLNPRCSDSRVFQKQGRAEDAAFLYPPRSFDVIICRQSLGYLDLDLLPNAVWPLLSFGGQFVFNSFREPKRFGSKNYQHNNSVFTEVHFYLFGRVLHIQQRDAEPMSWALARYYSPEQIETAFSRFTVNRMDFRSSHRWICTRGF